jgi:DNA repair protein RadC
MNHSKQVMSWSKISAGGRSATVVEVPSIVQLALLGNASSVILAHNHPSNQMKPSHADINLTNRVKKALQLFNIGLDDHIILTATGYVSFADRGLLNKSFSSNG